MVAPGTRWYVHKNGQQLGPYSFGQLQQQLAQGLLSPADAVWQEGTAGWVAVGSVPGLGAAMPAAAPPGAAPMAGAAPGLAPAVMSAGVGRKPGRLGAMKFHLGRTFAWNLRNVAVRPDEEVRLIALSVDDPAARCYLAWRRSLLLTVTVTSAITAAIGLCTALSEDTKGLSDLGKALQVFGALSLLVMPVAAGLAARAWMRHRRSRRRLAVGWSISFLLPLLLALVPLNWKLDLSEAATPEVAIGFQLLGAIGNYVTLMPTILALIPGVMRGCLRVKFLLPRSMLPGWFLVAATPLWIALFLVMFAIIAQLTSDALLMVGVVALAVAPLLYLRHVALFTRPVSGEATARLMRVQAQVRAVLGVGLVCVGIWLFTGQVFRRHILGFDEASSFLRPWNLDVFKLPLEFASHSLLTIALVADLMMAMNLGVWLETRSFVGTPEAREYDVTMSEIEEAGGRE
jgi:uncharacterized protein DUF4339